MKKILILLMLLSIFQGVFSLEITYIRIIDVVKDQVAFFEDNPKFISSRSYYDSKFIDYDIIDVQDGAETDFDDEEYFYSAFERGAAGQLSQFAYIYGEDKFGRHQKFLFSLLHGKKPISEETYQNLRTGSIIEYSNSGRAWSTDLYGKSGVRLGERKFVWDGEYFGIEFFSGSKTIDLPIEMTYGANSGSDMVNMSYDLFTGTFFEEMRYEGDEEIYSPFGGEFSESYDTKPEFSEILHIFNIIYDGSIALKTEIRETPSHEGKILGYLNESERVQVSKAENYEKKEGYQDYWYYVTSDSYSGWCTGEFLLIEGGTWYNRFELRDTYVEWDEIPESENILKTPLYGIMLDDENLYELPVQPPRYYAQEELESLENYPINGSVENGSVVEIIDRAYYSQVSGDGNYWCKIRLENGTKGWIVEDDIDIDLYGTRNLDTTGIPDEITEVEIVDPENLEIHGVMNDTRVRLRRAPTTIGKSAFAHCESLETRWIYFNRTFSRGETGARPFEVATPAVFPLEPPFLGYAF